MALFVRFERLHRLNLPAIGRSVRCLFVNSAVVRSQNAPFISACRAVTCSFPSSDQRRRCSSVPQVSRTWGLERALSVATLVGVPAVIFFPGNAFVDFSMGLLLPLHAHFGLHQVIVDYVHAKSMRRFCDILLPIITGFIIGGIFLFNTSDIGMSAGLHKLWKKL